MLKKFMEPLFSANNNKTELGFLCAFFFVIIMVMAIIIILINVLLNDHKYVTHFGGILNLVEHLTLFPIVKKEQ